MLEEEEEEEMMEEMMEEKRKVRRLRAIGTPKDGPQPEYDRH